MFAGRLDVSIFFAFVGQVTAVFEKNFAVSTSSGLLKNGVCVTRANCKSAMNFGFGGGFFYADCAMVMRFFLRGSNMNRIWFCILGLLEKNNR